ncbi:hypothetical protein [Taklimakanibacter albus]|uniref:Uncharacterized protein n=1 Tax=Taklimakanibacter albus TaxID=2800327 RepID=A0ACC5RDQ1_9HYPH|nr:hypothetical protein [Aestuariivirga sp. YIM B02566]MBK1870621.1 hypothetical protein [Aestuariivirga sp. YIM B02566]
MRQKDLTHSAVFGTISCGVLIGFVSACLVLPRGNFFGETMNSGEVIALVLGALTLVVGVVIPLAGIFAFVFARREALDKANECIVDAMKDGGELSVAANKTIQSAISDEQGTIRAYIDRAIDEKIRAQLAQLRVQRGDAIWGNEADEYGETASTKGRAP